MIVVGTMISLAYYLRVIAAVWMSPVPSQAAASPAPAIAGGAGPSGGRCLLVLGAIAVAAGATIFFGVWPSPLVEWAEQAGAAIGELAG